MAAQAIETTGIHLARRICNALTRTYSCEVSMTYGDASLDVEWTR